MSSNPQVTSSNLQTISTNPRVSVSNLQVQEPLNQWQRK